MAEHSVGVVAIGRNEGERLMRCLASLRDGAWPVVYVDSASTDGSVEAARAAGAIVVALDLATPFTAARARNEGAAALLAAHPHLAYIQFVDGDCEMVPGWIATARTFLDAHGDAAVACGRRRERFPDATLYNRLADAEWNTPVGEATACGGDALFRVEPFRAAGGYDATMIAGEEPELCNRLRAAGWRIHRLDAEMTIHDAAMTRFGQWWRRANRGGFGYAQVWSATRDRDQPLYGRELARAGGWTIAPPLAALAGAALHPALLLLAPAAYLAQATRMAMRDGGTRLAWQKAGLATIGKFAEAQGALRYARRRLAGRTGGTILYK